ncbi:MAG: hypothetical protein ISS15_18210 [Alphaproteobacteria bacterium]|nr:hypothetical protein [Alphaproteobacteria bacterium]MBL6939005.1 hypothetical protein [Alphaproteobacteria bacterium]MBL7099597.1 hypothetical protein [Alphaproteobacteria bacterium]
MKLVVALAGFLLGTLSATAGTVAIDSGPITRREDLKSRSFPIIQLIR